MLFLLLYGTARCLIFFTDPKDARDVMFRDLSDAVLPLFILNEAGYIS